MPATKKPTAPTGLGSKAKKLWTETVKSYELRIDELRILEDACREVDLIERIEKEMKTSKLVVRGSMGQPVASPLVQEIRQHRATLKTLIKALDLPEEEPTSITNARSASARAAANARWHKTSGA